ncbi:MAG: Gfo/Idh/MocA family oxidoreductase [Clostridium sp.]|uniref:Gfo/Idh/MocA family protein n=1 Tax=Clostridium sp. TaxID=1506 RepID=UPI0029073E63|nr:Gfo/Idh/MocA family oxidoreductase [Clostridium sp.]MDU7337677.1 Gfo/Idh/MocA family oxidoreductase [Clostridium sp.]
MAVQVRYGMVGGSMDAFIGEVHRKAIAFDPRVQLVAGCFSTDKEKNQFTGETYSLESERVYVSFEEMAKAESQRDDGIDFVSITTPNHTHYAVAKCFLEHGIHVVCEKPLCFTVQEAEELVRLSKEKNLFFAVTYTYSGYTMVKVMREMIAEGKIGNIAAVNAEYVQEWLIDELGTPNEGTAKLSVWRTNPEFSGIANCVGDIGTHIENTVHYLTGLHLKRLAATVNRYGKPLDLNANMLVEYENGVNGAYWCSQIAAGKLNGLCVRIYGSEGSLEWEQQFPDYVKYTPKGKPTQLLSRGTGYITEAAGAYSRIPSGHPEGLIIAFANIYKNVASAIIKRKSGAAIAPCEFDFPTAEDGLNGIKFVHAVIESAAKDSAWVTL